ncbi:MAG: TetR/AcrR family transcriptional regulator [Acidobacteriia bacterium]|nr:TetR/AcrR family transcriptional regulator [Terriglobia bacterium]
MPRSSSAPEPLTPNSDSRFDRQLARILEHATAIFYEKGYEGASMRDLSRVSGLSLAGLYYYFDSKERLLYLIQRHLFLSVMDLVRERLMDESDPEQRIRIFIRTHLEYFLAKPEAMKVLSHEDDVLKEELGTEISSLKRQYYRCCADLVGALKTAKGLQFNSRVAALSLFGMMNWIHTWYNPRVDGDAQTVAGEIADVFLRGIYSTAIPA